MYQRNPNQRYGLKLKAARSLYATISERYPAMPFSVRPFARRELLGLKVLSISPDSQWLYLFVSGFPCSSSVSVLHLSSSCLRPRFSKPD